MNEYTQHIVSRLKQQARHGGTILTESEEDANARKQKASQLQNAADSAERVKGIYDDLAKSITKLTATEAGLANGISKMIKLQQELSSKTLDTIKSINTLAQRNSDLQKTFGLSVSKAAAVGDELDVLSVSLGTSRANVEKNYVAMSKLTGGMVQNSKSLQKLNQYYTVNRGLTQEAANGLLMFASSQAQVDANGKLTEQSLENQSGLLRNQFAAIEKVTGIKGAQLEIETAIGTAASKTRLTFGKYPSQLGVAVMKAKALGLELADLEAVGDNLLNIESSVGEELNYQLLTGHRLVDNQGKSLTNKYREAYLTGKASDATDALNKIIDQEGDTLNNNLLARQQMAKTLGIEEDQLAKIVEKRKLMKNLINEATGKPISIDLFTDLKGQELEQALKDSGAASKDIAAIMKQDDTRSPEARAADSLASIETKGIKIQTDAAGGSEKIINATLEASEQMVKDFGAMLGKDGSLGIYMTAFNEGLGKIQLEREKYDTGADSIIQKLLNIEKGRGGTDALIATYAEQLAGAVNTLSTPLQNMLKGAKVEDMTVNNLNTGAEIKNDAVMINDGIRFNPRDKFRTINDGMTVAGTNVGGLDRYASQLEKRDRTFEQNMSRMISNMATNITQAIERANLKINVDRTFTGTSMNPRGKYGAS